VMNRKNQTEIGLLERVSCNTAQLIPPRITLFSFSPALEHGHDTGYINSKSSDYEVSFRLRFLPAASEANLDLCKYPNLDREQTLVSKSPPSLQTFGMLWMSDQSNLSSRIASIYSGVPQIARSNSFLSTTKIDLNERNKPKFKLFLSRKQKPHLSISKPELATRGETTIFSTMANLKSPLKPSSAEVCRLGIVRRNLLSVKVLQHKGDVECPSSSTRTSSSHRPIYGIPSSSVGEFILDLTKHPKPKLHAAKFDVAESELLSGDTAIVKSGHLGYRGGHKNQTNLHERPHSMGAYKLSSA
jgi:hypothetical protein